jgi:spermidine synthase
MKNRRPTLFALGTAAAVVSLAGIFANSVTSVFERELYDDEIVYSEQTQYQRIVITRFRDDIRLFLDGNLQFASVDEHRYHEVLVHVPMSTALTARHVLLLGAGDGLAVRELRKYPHIESITLVDIDPAMTRIAREHPLLTAINQNSLADSRVTVVNDDAWRFASNCPRQFDLIISDLPDPNDFGLGRLYSREFYALISRCLSANGVFITQATSPYFSRDAFWLIHDTLRTVFPFTLPLHADIPSFGPWGFVLASRAPLDGKTKMRADLPLQFLTKELFPTLFIFDGDMTRRGPEEINSVENQRLVAVYEAAWKRWN